MSFQYNNIVFHTFKHTNKNKGLSFRFLPVTYIFHNSSQFEETQIDPLI